MKLSMLTAVVDHRRRLKDLRKARTACEVSIGAISVTGSITCKAFHFGEEINLITVLGATDIRASLRELLDQRIAETVREIEAHGVDVDE